MITQTQVTRQYVSRVGRIVGAALAFLVFLNAFAIYLGWYR